MKNQLDKKIDLKMYRRGYSFGVLEYKTHSIPTMGASNNGPHMEPILLIEKFISENRNFKFKHKF